MITGEEKECLRSLFLDAGAVAAGFAEAGETDAAEKENYSRWIAEGKHAAMSYLEKHLPLKSHPRHVLEGATTVISVAFSYAPAEFRDPSLPMIATYALGKDYHEVIKRRLRPVVTEFRRRYGGTWRICVDSAPLAERYWAMKCGIGIRGKNGSVIVKNHGSYIFLAEVLTTLEIAPDAPSEGECMGCGKCRSRCPMQAITENGTIDSRLCLSYLTIEHRGEWEKDIRSEMQRRGVGDCLFGCDVCLRVCPHNIGVKPTKIEEFQPDSDIIILSADDVRAMDETGFGKLFSSSPVRRAGLDGLRRNIGHQHKP